MVIQIPVFFALFRILGSSIELRHAPFMLWINDLSAPDRLFHFPFTIPLMTPPSGIPVLTLLMGVSMFIQQKMTPTPGDPTQAKIMLLMPLIFTFMFINFPSGLVLYWLVNNVLSIGQQYRIAAALLGDPPVIMLDEPFNGMDPEGIVWMRGFLRALGHGGAAGLGQDAPGLVARLGLGVAMSAFTSIVQNQYPVHRLGEVSASPIGLR